MSSGCKLQLLDSHSHLSVRLLQLSLFSIVHSEFLEISLELTDVLYAGLENSAFVLSGFTGGGGGGEKGRWEGGREKERGEKEREGER